MVHDNSGKTHKQIMLSRSVDAAAIPEGNIERLEPGQPFLLTQSLGGSYTIQSLADNRKFRIEGKDGDAIGEPILGGPKTDLPTPNTPEEAVALAKKQLKRVHDPEIPVNIVDLGLVYEVDVHERGDGLYFAVVKMTLTAPGCGMGDFLIRDVERALKAIPKVDTVRAEIVFNPVWNPHTMMSTAAKLQLGLL